MGTDKVLKVQIKRVLVFPVRICYRSVCNHPFVVGLVCFFAILYRSFPLLFSLLVSASPVLVCTAVLLGILLSFGESNIPEIEIEGEGEEEDEQEEEEVSHDISSLRAGAVGDATVVAQREEGFGSEKFTGKRKDIAGKAVEEDHFTEDEVSKTREDDGLSDYVPLIDENSQGLCEKGVIEETERELDDVLLDNKKKEVLEEKEGTTEEFGHVQVAGDEDGGSPGESVEAQKDGHLDFSPDWKQVKGDEEEEEQDEEASDSGSDGAESSSPDASLADIIPMLDELHPLLNDEAPQTANRSLDGSDTGSERSDRSKESSTESDEDVDDQGDEEEDGDEDNDNEEEEEVQEGKEDESKSAIKWTEDDQKNLMDLGSLELERNQRLESLIARRRARRNLRLMAEKNLIDLDSADLPVNIPPISTSRHNPFDLPYDPYDDVPGSAPSVLLPRRNPFDLPYDSNEEKPNLKGDSFQQEFSTPQQREPLFRRHESFSVGPSLLGFPRHERQDLRWKPYFVPERFAGEGTSYTTFQRQLSEASESKLSSVPDTESASSVLEEEGEDRKLGEEGVSHETEMIMSEDHASILVECGSLASEDVDSVDAAEVVQRNVQDDGADMSLAEVEHLQEMDSTLSASGEATPVEMNASEILLRMGPAEEEYSSDSSLSSLTDTGENISGESQESATLEQNVNQVDTSTQSSMDSKLNVVGKQSLDSGISKLSLSESQSHYMNGAADDNQHKEPVLEPMANHVKENVVSTETAQDLNFPLNSEMMNTNQHGQSALKSLGDNISDSGISKQPSLESEPQHLNQAENDNQQWKHDPEPSSNHFDKSGISTQTSLKSDLHLIGSMMDDSHHRDPVYDSSPHSIDKYLSFSSVSSDTLGEILEMSSPPALAEPPVIRSEAHLEIRKKDSSDNKEMHEEYLQGDSRKEIEPKIREAAEICGSDVLKLGPEGVDNYYDSQNGSETAESEVQYDSANSHPLAAENGSLKEGAAIKEDGSFHEEDQIHLSHQGVVENLDSASSYQVVSQVITLSALEKNYVEQNTASSYGLDPNLHANGFQAEELDLVVSTSDCIHSNDISLSKHEEGHPTEVAEETLEAHLDVSSSGNELIEEKLVRKDEAPDLEHNQAHLLASDATINAIHQDVYKEVVSSESTSNLSKEEASFDLEKRLSWSDKPMVESSSDGHDIAWEPPSSLAAGVEDVSISEKTSILEAYDHSDTMPRDVASLTYDFTAQPPESVECNSPFVKEELKDDILDKIVYEDSSHVLEHSNHSSESYGSAFTKEGEIKEIDEGLLSELDTVGDFSVKEVVGESIHDEKMPGRSCVDVPELDSLLKDSSPMQNEPEISVLEVRSVEDIELAFKQLHEGVDVEEVILPSMIEAVQVPDDSSGPGEPSSDFPTVEARSLEDIHIAMKQVSKGNNEEKPEPSYSKDEQVEVNKESEVKELPVLEVRTVADIDVAFKQLHEGIDVQEVILPSAIDHQLLVDASTDTCRTSSDFPVVEARTLVELHAAIKQASKSNTMEQLRPSDTKDEPSEEMEVSSGDESSEGRDVSSVQEIRSRDVEVSDEVDITKDIQCSTVEVREVDCVNWGGPVTVEPVVPDDGSIALHELKQDVDVKSGNSSFKESDAVKEVKSHGSSSRSSDSD